MNGCTCVLHDKLFCQGDAPPSPEEGREVCLQMDPDDSGSPFPPLLTFRSCAPPMPTTVCVTPLCRQKEQPSARRSHSKGEW